MKNGDTRRGPFSFSSIEVRRCRQAADAGADQTPVRSGLPRRAASRNPRPPARGGHRIDDEIVDLALFLGLHPVVGIERAVGRRRAAPAPRSGREIVDTSKPIDSPGARAPLENALPGRFDARSQRRNHAQTRDDDAAHGRRLLEELDRVADGDDRLGRVVRNLDAELFLESHHQLDRVEAVGAQVVDEIRAFDDLVGIHAEMLDHDLLHALGDIAHDNNPHLQ
jgi:hypothetical protein